MGDEWRKVVTSELEEFLKGLFFGLLTGFWIGITIVEKYYHYETIRRGLAIHDPITGDWKWNDGTNGR